MLILCVQNPYIGKKVPKVTESTVVQLLIHYFFFFHVHFITHYYQCTYYCCYTDF